MPLARALAVVAVALALPARAGVIIEGKQQGDLQRLAMEGKRLRMEGKPDATPEGAAGETVVIFDGEARKMVQLRPAKKTYSEVTQADMDAMRAQIGDSLAALPPEQRAEVEAQVKSLAATAAGAKWEKTGRRDEAAGKPCDVYRLKTGEERGQDEVCVVAFGTFGVGKDDVAALAAFEQFIAQLAIAGGAQAETRWSTLPGIPVASWRLDGDERKETFRAAKVTKARIGADQFAPPAGWTKVKPGEDQ